MEEIQKGAQVQPANGNGKDWKKLSPVDRKNTIQNLLVENKRAIEMAIPKHLTADKLIRVAITALSKTPKLLECSKSSLLGSIMLAGQLGLNPDGILGQGYLIPFWNGKSKQMECQFMIGYRGLINLAIRSGQVLSLQARCVYENDKFDYELGLNEKLIHVPAAADRGELTHVYAIVRFKDGGYMFEVMTKNEVELIRLMSKNKDGNIWHDFYDEMAKKTAIRKLSKICPLSEDFQTATSLDEQAEVMNESQRNDRGLLSMDLTGDIKTEVEDNINSESETDKEQERQDKINGAKEKGNEALKDTIEKAKQNGGK